MFFSTKMNLAALLTVAALLMGGAGTTAPTDAPATRPYDETQLKKSFDAFIAARDVKRFAADNTGAIRDLDSPDSPTREKALRIIAATADINAIPLIIPLLDSNSNTHIYAGLALEQIVSAVSLKRRDPAAPGIVLKPLGPNDPDLRPLAWVVLKMLRAPDDGNTGAYASTMCRYLELKEFERELQALCESRHPAVYNAAAEALKAMNLKVPAIHRADPLP
jgi:hypothetical protein